jgi:general secretion pathway protein E
MPAESLESELDQSGAEAAGAQPGQSLGDPYEQVGEHLVGAGRLSDKDLSRCRRLAQEGGEPLTGLLQRLGLVSQKDLAEGFAEVLGLELVTGDAYPPVAACQDHLSKRFMKESHVVPVSETEDSLVLAMADPADRYALEAVRVACGREVTQQVGLPSEIDAAIERLYGEGRSALGEIVDDLGEGGEKGEDDIEQLRDMASEAPVIRLVNLIIQRAVEARASDIHIEPFQERLKVRYRVDGVLQEVEAPPARSTAAVISRVKIMANLNIAERRLPQDGRIPLRVQGKEMDLRVSTVPTLYGESVVLRLLDKESVRFDFAALGFDGEPLSRLLHVLDLPNGIVLVTGPTGSGKSTTLYTALHRLNTPERKIITVEDPVEYQLEGINQIQVKPQIGMDFAGALRAIVRQDPDIIMVGEMRDLETARIAVQSALTGHLVLSTLHTNDAAGGVARMLDMGVEDYLLTSTVNGIVAQRLVRRLCPHCRSAYEPMPEVVAELDLERYHHTEGPLQLYRAEGCERCGGSGYHGRLVVTEVLVMTDELRQGVMRHANAAELNRTAQAEGMESMYQDGLRKAVAGFTTIEEVARVAEET